MAKEKPNKITITTHKNSDTVSEYYNKLTGNKLNVVYHSLHQLNNFPSYVINFTVTKDNLDYIYFYLIIPQIGKVYIVNDENFLVQKSLDSLFIDIVMNKFLDKIKLTKSIEKKLNEIYQEIYFGGVEFLSKRQFDHIDKYKNFDLRNLYIASYLVKRHTELKDLVKKVFDDKNDIRYFQLLLELTIDEIYDHETFLQKLAELLEIFDYSVEVDELIKYSERAYQTTSQEEFEKNKDLKIYKDCLLSLNGKKYLLSVNCYNYQFKFKEIINDNLIRITNAPISDTILLINN